MASTAVMCATEGTRERRVPIDGPSRVKPSISGPHNTGGCVMEWAGRVA